MSLREKIFKVSNLRIYFLSALFIFQCSCASLSSTKASEVEPTSILEVDRDDAEVPHKIESHAPNKVVAQKKKLSLKEKITPKDAVTQKEVTPTKEIATKSLKKIVARSSSTVEISGDSTLKKYSSRATQLGIRVSVSPPLDKLEDLMKEELTEFVLVIPLKGMKSGSDLLDQHMLEALKANRFAEIRGEVKSYKNNGKNTDGSYSITASVSLNIAGKSETVPVDAKLSLEGSDLRIQGQKALLMTDFDVTPPELMLGTIKTANEIVIQFNFLLGLEDKADDKKQNIKQGAL